MCGIIAYIGLRKAAPILLEGLEKLEYRGYDSAGLAILNKEKKAIEIIKCKGRLKNLAEKTKNGTILNGSIGIGHTRWATHGEPSDLNSHPHLSQNNRFAVVHNGIIENYQVLKTKLEANGFIFQSDTDTEVIAHLIEYYDTGNLIQTVIKVSERLKGSYAMSVLDLDHPDSLIAIRKDSPLIVGKGDNENFIASDIPAILTETREIYLMEDHELVQLSKNKIQFFNFDGEPITKILQHIDWDITAAEKGGYEHFMMKEIMEQPKALRETNKGRIKDSQVHFDIQNLAAETLEKIEAIHLVGCGSAYHVAKMGQYLMDHFSLIPTDAEVASEYRYKDLHLNENHLVVIISQSGETADSLAALRAAKQMGAKTLAIVNVLGSSIAREAGDVLYTHAGPEIAVATTKAYTAQIEVMLLLALYIAQANSNTKENPELCQEIETALDTLIQMPDTIAGQLESVEHIQHLASKLFNSKNIFFMGRGIDYALSLEGSLKLKEISYIHSEATPAGELKHGPISLIQNGTLVVALCTQLKLLDKMISNIREVRTRGAAVLVILPEDIEIPEDASDYIIRIPKTTELLQGIPAIVPLQLFAYYVAVMNGCDVDKPRNLAKSVTVE